MKRLYALLMAGVLTIAIAVPTFAATSPEGTIRDDVTTESPAPSATPSPSPSATPQVQESTNETVAPVAGTAEAVSVIESASTVVLSVAGASATAPAPAMAQHIADVTSNPTVLSDLNVPAAAKLVAAVEVNYSGEIPAGGVQIPFTVSSAKEGDTVYVLHRQSQEPYQWEVVGQGVLGADLTVVGTFHSFSPVAFMVVDANESAQTVKAPKTGEF